MAHGALLEESGHLQPVATDTLSGRSKIYTLSRRRIGINEKNKCNMDEAAN